MTRVPISQEAVGRALSKTLDHYDKAPGFMDEAYIIDTQEGGGLGGFPLGPSRRGMRKGGI